MTNDCHKMQQRNNFIIDIFYDVFEKVSRSTPSDGMLHRENRWNHLWRKWSFFPRLDSRLTGITYTVQIVLTIDPCSSSTLIQVEGLVDQKRSIWLPCSLRELLCCFVFSTIGIMTSLYLWLYLFKNGSTFKKIAARLLPASLLI